MPVPSLDPHHDLPLGRVPGLTDSHQQRCLVHQLATLGVTDQAQLYGLLSVEAARDALGATLGLATPQLLGLLMASRMAVGAPLADQLKPATRAWPIGVSLAPDLERSLDAQLMAMNQPKPGQKGVTRIHQLSFSLQPTIKGTSLSWVEQLGPVRDQGTRATSPAFAMTAANELLRRQLGKAADLSEQFLFYEAKQLDEAEGRQGSPTSLAAVATVLLKNGQCRVSSWAYSPVGATLDHGQKPLNARSEAGNFRCRPQHLSHLDLGELKAALAAGYLIAMTVPVYASWLASPEVVRSGRLTLPLPGESPLGYQALTAVGYDDASSVLYARNSWGPQWAAQSPVAPGYATLPFGYLPLVAEAYTLSPGT